MAAHEVKTPAAWPFPEQGRGMVPQPPTWARPLEELRRNRNLVYDAMSRGDRATARRLVGDMQVSIDELTAALSAEAGN